ncbi:hypothetical protein C8Q77DRAFT_247006 [Trametes polyzona]|nr:hypothetical protein C8Q77DRAFT_247006 [Trametes polyzona]
MPLDNQRLLLNGLAPGRLSSSSGPYARPAKRQKTEGMNSRYDGMIRTVNIMHGSPSTERRSRRGHTLSSSSATDYDTPRTPVGRPHPTDVLGRGISVLKMRMSGPSVTGTDMFAPDAFQGPADAGQNPANSLPPWLRGTLSSLDSNHPLRHLAPGEPTTRGDSSPSVLDPSSDMPFTPAAESLFAFSVPVRDDPSHDTKSYVDVSRELMQIYDHPLLELPAALSSATEPPLRPFSTPGPTSIISIAAEDERKWAPTRQDNWPLFSVSTRPTMTDMEEQNPNFVPFSTPGPLCAPRSPDADHTPLLNNTRYPSPPAYGVARFSPVGSADLPWKPCGTSPVYPTQISRMRASPVSRAPPDPAGSLAPAFKPYTTPGPAYAALLAGDPRSVLAAHVLMSPIYSPSIDPPRSAEVVQLPSPRSPVLSKTVKSCDTEAGTVHELDFKWERFDRTDVRAVSSSSPIRSGLGSEETFWSQPAPIALQDSDSTRLHPARAALLPFIHSDFVVERRSTPACDHGSSALARATGRSDRVSREHAYEVPKTPISQNPQSPQGTFPSQEQDDEGGPFAWIVPPRDQPAPSTPPRRTTYSQIGPHSRTPVADADSGASIATCTDVRGIGEGGDGVSKPAIASRRGAPFAPAPGIYVSPLQEGHTPLQSATTANSPQKEVGASRGAEASNVSSKSSARVLCHRSDKYTRAPHSQRRPCPAEGMGEMTRLPPRTRHWSPPSTRRA